MKSIGTIALLLLTTLGTNSFAGTIEKNIPVEFRYLGASNEQTFFNLKVAANETENDFLITVTDENGATYYKENVKSKKSFSKRIIFGEEINDAKLFVTVTCRNNNKSVVYKVENSFQQNFSQDIVVTEIK